MHQPSLFHLAFILFLLMDSLGNIPLYITFLREIPEKRQIWIIFREMTIALIIIFLFNFLGEALLQFLAIGTASVLIAGGIILFILSLRMIFPPLKDNSMDIGRTGEPFIVPLAVPLVAGPAVLAAVILYSSQYDSYTMIFSIFLAWLASLGVLLLAPFLRKALGIKGLLACERLMGLILILIAVQMALNGLSQFFFSQH